jgi:hypothetical protein
MVGFGSGRWPSYGGKAANEDSMSLDIRRLGRAGALAPGRSCIWQWTVNDRVQSSIRIEAEAWQVTLAYSYTPRDRPAEAIWPIVALETTPCTLGGARPWFRCPACARRVAVIYGLERLFACRRCKGLAYASQAEAADDRALCSAGRIRKKLGWVPGIAHGHGPKPAGMHWLNFYRLCARHDSLVQVSFAGTVKKVGLFRERLDASDIDVDAVLEA